MDIRPPPASIAVRIGAPPGGRRLSGDDPQHSHPRNPRPRASHRPVPDPRSPARSASSSSMTTIASATASPTSSACRRRRGVGTTSQQAETLAAIERLRPSVVVIDPYLPGSRGWPRLHPLAAGRRSPRPAHRRHVPRRRHRRGRPRGRGRRRGRPLRRRGRLPRRRARGRPSATVGSAPDGSVRRMRGDRACRRC